MLLRTQEIVNIEQRRVLLYDKKWADNKCPPISFIAINYPFFTRPSFTA